MENLQGGSVWRVLLIVLSGDQRSGWARGGRTQLVAGAAMAALLVMIRGGVVLAIFALAGCASTPQATPERDAEAKRFMPVAGEATIYLYRPDFPTYDQNDPAIYVDDRLIGAMLPGTFFRFPAGPGTRVIRSHGQDAGDLKIEARSGELHFVSLTVISGQSRYAPVSAEAGKREIVRCCALMENWAPDQRRLLR